MQKIIVVKTEKSLIDVLSLTYDELYDMVADNYKNNILKLFLELKKIRKVYPAVNEIKDVVVHAVYQSRFSVPLIGKFTDVEASLPWNYSLPSQVPADALRIITLSRKKYAKGVVPANILVDILGFSIKNNDFKISKIGAALKNIIHLEHLRYNPAKILLNYMSFKSVPKLFEPKAIEMKPIDDPFVNNVKKYLKLRDIYTSIEMFISDIIKVSSVPDLWLTDELTDDMIEMMQKSNKTSQDMVTIAKLKNEDTIKKAILVKFINTKYPEKNITFKMSLGSILARLTKAEVDDVMTYYTEFMTNYNNQKNNNCEHVTLVAAMDNAIKYSKKMKIMKKLEEFMDDRVKIDSLITCTKCKYPLMCPHLYRKYILQWSGVQPTDIQEEMTIFVDDTVRETFKGFCKICMEEIADYTMGDIADDSQRTLYKGVFSFLWKSIIAIYQTLIFSKPVPVIDFCVMLSDIIMPALINSGIPELNQALNIFLHDDILTYKIQMYVLLFIYAVIVNIIRYNSFNPDNKYIKVKPIEKVSGTDPSKFVEVFLARFDTIHRYVYKSVEINLISVFKTVYVLISKTKEVAFLIKNPNNQHLAIFNDLNCTTMFKYAYKMAIIVGDLDENSSYSKIFSVIFGIEMADFLKDISTNLMQNFYIPKNINNVTEAYIRFMKYVKTNERDFVPAPERTISFGDPTTTMSYNLIPPPPREFKGKLSLIFDSKGNPHNWNKYICDDGDIKSRKEPIPEGKKFSDYVCGICNIKFGDTFTIKNEELSDVVSRMIKFKTFFMFYYVKCPAGTVHVFENSTCKQCGATRKMLAARDIEAAKKYYEKYKETYKNKLEELNRLPAEESFQYSDYVINLINTNVALLSIAEKYKIPTMQLEVLGRIEGLLTSEVSSETASKVESIYDNSILRLKTYVMLTYKIYNIYRFSSRLLESHDRINVIKVYEDLKFGENVVRELETLPDIPVSYNNNIENLWKKPVEPVQVYQTILYTLCEILQWIEKTTNTTLTNYIINYIVTEDSFMCKTDKYNSKHFNHKINYDINPEDIEFDDEDTFDAEEVGFYEVDADYVKVKGND